MNRGPRPETSVVSTDNYQRGFTDRWYDNELRITRGAATGVDILDRHDDQFDSADASCIRDQQTFSIGEGAFIVNKDGPVRAIRDFVGANSGPHVQRQHIFYDDLEVINTFLRVHPIPGVVDFFDYSAAGSGLTYENGVMTPGGLGLRHAAGRSDDRRSARRGYRRRHRVGGRLRVGRRPPGRAVDAAATADQQS